MDIFGKNRENTMKLKLLSFAFLAFLFAACGDDSSSSAGDIISTDNPSASSDMNISTDKFSCVVKTGDNRVRQTIVVPGEFYGYSEMIVKGSQARAVVKNYYIGRSEAEIAEVCEEMEDQSDDYDSGSFMCNKDSSKFTITIPKAYASPLDEVKEEMKEECKDYEEDWKEKQAMLSSSSKPASSSMVSSSSSAKSSSLNEESSSSSDESNSSNEELSSSSEDSVFDAKKNLDLCGTVDWEVVSKYDVAYEFADTVGLGMDYVGSNNASVGEGAPQGDCENLILNGKSGLIAYSSDDFNANHFILETRIFPTAFSSMQNIFVAEPPGSNGAGWILRIENGVIKFLFRDEYQSWEKLDVGKISLEEWTTIKIEKTKNTAESGDNITVFFNDAIAYSTTTDSDVSGFSGKLGIGYDAANQDFHDRYFVGMIDYIRFDNLDN